MIGIGRIMKRLRSNRLRDNEVRKLVRKLPVFLPPSAQTPENLEKLTFMILRHSIRMREDRLHARYLMGKMSYAKYTRIYKRLRNRCVVVEDSIGNTFHVDHRVLSRQMDRT